MAGLSSNRVLIGHGESDRVAIEVTGPAGENWFTANVRVVSGIWSGDFRWHFHKGELHLEPNLELEMIGDGKGHIAVKGRARAEFGTGTHLTFSLDVDQTDLPNIVKSLFAADP